jgi:polygalacturonase
MKAAGTTFGLRFKSTVKRGGTIEDIYFHNIKMTDVEHPLIFDLNWYPAYSNSVLPSGYDSSAIPEHWKKMLAAVDPKQGTPKFRNINFVNVKATGASVCIQAHGIETSTLDNFVFKNVILQGKKAGKINYSRNWTYSDFTVDAPDKLEITNQNDVEGLQKGLK